MVEKAIWDEVHIRNRLIDITVHAFKKFKNPILLSSMNRFILTPPPHHDIISSTASKLPLTPDILSLQACCYL